MFNFPIRYTGDPAPERYAPFQVVRIILVVVCLCLEAGVVVRARIRRDNHFDQPRNAVANPSGEENATTVSAQPHQAKEQLMASGRRIAANSTASSICWAQWIPSWRRVVSSMLHAIGFRVKDHKSHVTQLNPLNGINLL